MTTKAADVLTAALGHMQDRAATYDKPEGERSMPATVAAFNALTGHSLTAEQGWLFMTVLKLCRTQQGGHRPDNYEDGAAYFALMGEQAACDRVVPAATAPLWTLHEGAAPVWLPEGPLALLHRDGTESVITKVDPSGPYWHWLGREPRGTDIVGVRQA